MNFEIEIIKFFQNGQTPFFDLLFYFFSFFASILGVIMIGLFFYLFKSKKFALFFVLCSFVNVFFNYFLKILINRPRPYEISNVLNLNQAIGKSFPSGHMVSATTISFFVIYFICTKYKSKQTIFASIILACLYLSGVAISRMYFGQHYLTDLIAGLFLGGMLSILQISLVIYKKIKC